MELQFDYSLSLVVLLIDLFKIFVATLVRQALNCLFARTLSIRHSFHNVNVETLMSLAKLYPRYFSSKDLRNLSLQEKKPSRQRRNQRF
jgi:hypothetical protein